ncbi:hypothetical protein EXS70_02395 [Candidatus Peribacteria bacterium]|nr:hypothetical protein [Candidatus Peribacteria bacterium]
MALLRIFTPSNELIQRVIAVSLRESDVPLTTFDFADIQAIARFWVDDNVPNEVRYSAFAVEGSLDVTPDEFAEFVKDAQELPQSVPTLASL